MESQSPSSIFRILAAPKDPELMTPCQNTLCTWHLCREANKHIQWGEKSTKNAEVVVYCIMYKWKTEIVLYATLCTVGNDGHCMLKQTCKNFLLLLFLKKCCIMFFFPVFKCHLQNVSQRYKWYNYSIRGKVLFRANELTFFWSTAQAFFFFVCTRKEKLI